MILKILSLPGQKKMLKLRNGFQALSEKCGLETELNETAEPWVKTLKRSIGLLVVRPRRVDGLSLCRCSSKAPPRFISGSTSMMQYLHFMDTLSDGLSARGNC